MRNLSDYLGRENNLAVIFYPSLNKNHQLNEKGKYIFVFTVL